MKLSIERAALLRSLSHVQNVVERRTTIPILSNVKLAAEAGGRLGLTATDMDLSLVAQEEADVGRGGTTTVGAHTLFDIVRKLPDGSSVAIEQDGQAGEITVRAGRSVFNLPTLPADEFPAIGEEQLGVRFSLPAPDMAKLIDKTRFAISTEETRYYLNGLYLHVVSDGGTPMLRAVATDGHRLALAEMPAPQGASTAPGVIVPRKTVQELRRLLDDATQPVELQISQQKVRLEFGGAALTSKVIDGSFPDYVRVIPRNNEKVALIDNTVFASAVDRVATISAEKSRSVKLAFESGRVVLTVRNMEAGQAVEEVEIDYEGEPFEIGFNARYLLDVAGQIQGENAEFRFADPSSPTLVLDPADPGAQYVLMPLRV